jgi:hypothetical protein
VRSFAILLCARSCGPSSQTCLSSTLIDGRLAPPQVSPSKAHGFLSFSLCFVARVPSVGRCFAVLALPTCVQQRHACCHVRGTPAAARKESRRTHTTRHENKDTQATDTHKTLGTHANPSAVGRCVCCRGPCAQACP